MMIKILRGSYFAEFYLESNDSTYSSNSFETMDQKLAENWEFHLTGSTLLLNKRRICFLDKISQMLWKIRIQPEMIHSNL
jgi:hypothetical protein